MKLSCCYAADPLLPLNHNIVSLPTIEIKGFVAGTGIAEGTLLKCLNLTLFGLQDDINRICHFISGCSL